MTKKILITILIVLTLAAIVFALIMGQGSLFQGSLYNLRPIYSECRIEGKDFQSNDIINCENFIEQLNNNTFPDGEYTIFTKYTDNKLQENIIPIRISNNGRTTECTFIENGYEPQISVFPISSPLTVQQLKNDREIPIYEQGTVLIVNFIKNGQQYVYDTNICEKSLRATIYDSNKQELGEARLDFNSFINSRPMVNELLVNNTPYYTDQSGKTIKDFRAGNIFAAFYFAPELFFKFTIPCSKEKVNVQIPSIETNKDVFIPLKGLEPEFLETCGSRLYLSFQNPNRADEIQIIDQINIEQKDTPGYSLKLSQLRKVRAEDATFPISLKVSLHLRDRSDSKEMVTLGAGLLNITGHVQQVKNTSQSQTEKETSTTDISTIIEETSNVSEEAESEEADTLELEEEAIESETEYDEDAESSSLNEETSDSPELSRNPESSEDTDTTTTPEDPLTLNPVEEDQPVTLESGPEPILILNRNKENTTIDENVILQPTKETKVKVPR